MGTAPSAKASLSPRFGTDEDIEIFVGATPVGTKFYWDNVDMVAYMQIPNEPEQAHTDLVCHYKF